jgi:predicted ArsR family transcriptional regulator
VEALPKLNPLFHQPVRTQLVMLLRIKARSFSQLKAIMDVTDGNLDAHLRKLSAGGFLHSRMVYEGRPHTDYELSPSGAAAFRKYLNDLRSMMECLAEAD